MEKNDGGPAFPTSYEVRIRGIIEVHYADGMTLRDYFAAKAMNGLCSYSEYSGSKGSIAKYAYELADAMLAEREKE